MELGLGSWLQSGELVQVLADWCEERYPLYAYYASRHLPPAKIRAFLDFVLEFAREDPSWAGAQRNRPTGRSRANRSVK
jgi:DNA-binding transcriptional LysR family regulator